MLGLSSIGLPALILRGKYKDYTGYLMYRAEPHPLATNKPRWALRVLTQTNWITLLLQEEGFLCLNTKKTNKTS